MRLALIGTMCALVVAGEAMAGPPGNRVITLNIREDPTDAASQIITTIELEISAVSMVNNDVGWQVDLARIANYDTSGNRVVTWEVLSPLVNSADGLWWVEHNDPQFPTAGEFDILPTTSGVGSPSDPQRGDLTFSVSAARMAPGTRRFNGRETLVSYYLAEDPAPPSPPPPPKEDEDVPSEIHPDQDP